MNIFDILKEAKNPSGGRQVIRVSTGKTTDYSDDIDNEQDSEETAPDEVNIDTTGDSDSTDYSEDIEEVEPSDEPQEDSDNTEDDNESTDYTEDIDNDDEYGDEEETDDTGEVQSTDYTEELNNDGESEENDQGQYQEEQPQELSPEEKLELQQNNELLTRTIDLYYSITGIVNKLDSINYSTIISNKISNQVKSNFSDLADYMYKFITKSFIDNTYVKNLYIYNYFIESYKINIKMLEKITTFTE